MVRLTLCGAALLGLIACETSVPYSNPNVTTISQAQRDAALAQSPGQPLPPAQPVTTAPLGSDPAAQPLPGSVISAVNDDPAEAQAAANAAAANSGVVPVQASPSNPQPVAVNAEGISSEQDFGAVSSQRSIESDAQKIANNRAQYTVIEPTALPTRPGSNQPNIVEYALRTTHPVGAQLYRRVNLRSATRHANTCARFQSPDQAQTEFLARGGPERDRRGLDPDGDGYACSWDPTPFRTARAAAQPTVGAPLDAVGAQPEVNGAPTSPVIEPLIISTE